MLAAEQNEAEQELPKSICQPSYVRLSGLALTTSCFDPRRALDQDVGSAVLDVGFIKEPWRDLVK